MKRRFEIHLPRNGRAAPPSRHGYSFRRPAPDDQPAPEQAPSSGSQPAGDAFASGAELRLQDEIPEAELAEFRDRILEYLSQPGQDPLQAVAEQLPSFVKLKIEYHGALEAQREQRRFTKKLVRASEPLLNHESVPESEKSGLLDVSVLCVEKMMQLKMRVTHLAQRIEFLVQEIPRYLYDRSKEQGCSDQLSADMAGLAKTVLQEH